LANTNKDVDPTGKSTQNIVFKDVLEMWHQYIQYFYLILFQFQRYNTRNNVLDQSARSWPDAYLFAGRYVLVIQWTFALSYMVKCFLICIIYINSFNLCICGRLHGSVPATNAAWWLLPVAVLLHLWFVSDKSIW
jgi:hypothetical protein